MQRGYNMFICSMRMSKKKMLAIFILLIVVVAGVIFLITGRSQDGKSSENKVSLNVASDEDVAKYVKSFGWEITEPAEEIVDVSVPLEFNDVYENYNALQKKQGFDLEPYKGSAAQRYTFAVLNYPDYPENIKADVIVCKQRIIAADICSVEINGFMHEMNRKENT